MQLLPGRYILSDGRSSSELRFHVILTTMLKNVAVYVDGLNFYHSTKELPFADSANVDLKSLSQTFLKEEQKLAKIHNIDSGKHEI